MLFNKAKLNRNIFKSEKLNLQTTRLGFGEALVKLGEENKNIVVLSADLSASTKADLFKQKFPERFIEVGVAEQNMLAIAAGLAQMNKVPVLTSYAAFSPGRNNEQIRTLAALSNLPLKIIGSHGGLSVGPDGATHQALEDIALMRVLPNMTVISPADYYEAQKATMQMVKLKGPVYLRLSRPHMPVFTSKNTPFQIGKAENFLPGKDITIIGHGPILYRAILAAKQLKDKGVRAEIINCHTIKPLDKKSIISSAKKTGAVLTIEDHQVAGGLGSAIAELLSQELPVPMKIMGVNDKFGQSGQAEQLWDEYGLRVDDIIQQSLNLLKKKKYET